MPRRLLPVTLRVVGASFATILAVALVACTPSVEPSPTPSHSSAATPAPTPTAEAPTLQPDGTADDNLPLFTAVVAQVWGSDQQVSGRAYIDALVAAGFDRAQMQVTEDLTTVGNAVESLQFSVRWGETMCLIGQVGPSTGDPVTMVMNQLGEGRCLIGNTRPIDW